MKRLPDFRFDLKAKLAHFEVIVSGTKGDLRRGKAEPVVREMVPRGQQK